MKIIKTISISIGIGLLLCLLIISFQSPQSHMERSILINSNPEKVFPWVNNYKNFQKWSPWSIIDPNTQYHYEGPESGSGSRMIWTSKDKNVGNGEQWIIESKENKYVKSGLKFGDFKGIYTSEFLLNTVAEGETKITWTYDGNVSGTGIMNVFFGKLFGLFTEKMLGPSYEKGLTALKEMVESASPELVDEEEMEYNEENAEAEDSEPENIDM